MSQRMKILVDHGAYDNFGDLAMLEAAVDRLRQIEGVELHVQDSPQVWGHDNVQTVGYHVPLPDTALNRKVRSRVKSKILRRGLRVATTAWRDHLYRRISRGSSVGPQPVETGAGRLDIARWCQQYDALFIAGGGDMTDVFPQALWRSCALIHGFADQRKMVLLSGQQLGPMRRSASVRLLHSALRRATFVGVREPTESVRVLMRAEVDRARMAMMGDDSLGIVAAGDAEVGKLLEAHGVAPRKFIAVNVRVGPYTPVQPRHLRDVANLLNQLSREFELPLLAVPISVCEGDSDVASARLLRDQLGEGRLQILDRSPLSASLLKGVLGSAHAAIGMSYHFCTFALCQGVPAIALYVGDYYEQKATGLSAFWGDRRLARSIEDLATTLAAVDACATFADQSLREQLRARAREATSAWEHGFDQHIMQPLRAQASKRPARPGAPQVPSIPADIA
jgi:polysaccharide pyruvyl transferase WcaK-like protein